MNLPVKIPLSLALSNLKTVVDSIDSGDLTGIMAKEFHEISLANAAAAVDRRICFIDIAEGVGEDDHGQIGTCRALARKYTETARYIEKAVEHLKQKTIQIIEDNPDEKCWGGLGRLSVGINQEALNCLIPITKKSVDDIISEADIHQFKVDQKYLIQRTFYCLHNATIKEDLQRGATLSWANLTRGKKLKIDRK